MKIGVVADSHEHGHLLRSALRQFVQEGVGAILHLGDIIAPFTAKLLLPPHVPAGLPMHVVYGNNDGEREGLERLLPRIQDGPLRLTLAGRRIVMIHALESLEPEDIAGADVVFSGHTHELLHEVRDGVLFLNPGECCGVLTGKATAAIVDLDDLSVRVIPLDNRP